MRIGLYGGTFDPPHTGHLALAQAALEHLQLDEVLFMPANRNPLKKFRSAASAKQRIEMVKLLIDSHEKLAVSDLEISRGGPSYTVETLVELTMAFPADYWLLMGADTLRSFGSWKSPEKILRLARLGVALRAPETEVDALRGLPDEMKQKIDFLPMKLVDISSTELRDKLAGNQPTSPWLPASVLKYIKANGLYRG